MATLASGGQKIGWKYSTPLQAEYLNTFLAGITSEGLLSRPNFVINGNVSDKGASIIINPFSMIVEPSDYKNKTYTDELGNPIVNRVVKLTFTEPVTISISPSTIAIGISYSFSEPGQPPASEWYADIRVLSPSDFIKDEEGNIFDGIVIGTVQWYNTDNLYYCNVSSSGADISTPLLEREGWNPNCWLSLISPRRIVGDAGTGNYYNRLEVRNGNDTYYGYLSGNKGVVPLGFTQMGDNIIKNPLYYNFYKSEPYNKHGERGYMPRNYNAFSLRSDGLTPTIGVDKTTENVPNASDTLPITNQLGGVFAMVDASIQNSESNRGKLFTNALKIYPVEKEHLNIFYDSNTLFIQ